MTLAADDVYELALRQTYNSNVLMNVIHIKCRGALATPQSDFQRIADYFKVMAQSVQESTLTWESWKATQVAGAGITYDTVTCRRSGGDFYEGSFTAPTAGQDAAAAPGPNFTAIVVALKTGISGRSKRGQFYIGGLDQNASDASNTNKLSASRKATLQSALTTFWNSMKYTGGTDPDFYWVVFSKVIASGCKYVNGVGGAALTHVQAGNQPAASVAVTSATIRDWLSPMNRRKIGVGI